jgi:aerobic-type carbon monoxide dehydrogenase small subunit (CoxS/CutS family)
MRLLHRVPERGPGSARAFGEGRWRGADLQIVAEALDGHLCRCTGYIKYHEAVRAVILADPGRYLS